MIKIVLLIKIVLVCPSHQPPSLLLDASFTPGRVREVSLNFVSLNTIIMANDASTLQYLETYTVDRFKTIKGVSALNVIKNPHTGCFFFTCPDDSTVSGKVSKGDWQSDPRISKCVDKESGEQFYILHKYGSSAANVVATL